MTVHLHLIGGAGRIGTTLSRSLLADPLDDLGSLSIYCDLTKATGLQAALEYKGALPLQVESYSRFSIRSTIDRGWSKQDDRHIVLLMRGVNDKKFWLNQPLEALSIQLQACNSLVESDVELYPDVRVIHFTSQLCDLIEGGSRLDEVCGGLESYRRPYMISRLHQEAVLTAYAYQHSIPTCFIRLASVYGFEDEHKSPWVLNALIKQQLRNKTINIRNPDSLLYLVHKDPLIRFLRLQIDRCKEDYYDQTITYCRPPMLPMTVESLANLISSHSNSNPGSFALDKSLSLLCGNGTNEDIHEHLRLLQSVVGDLITHG